MHTPSPLWPRVCCAMLLTLTTQCQSERQDEVRRESLIGNIHVAFEREGAAWVGDWPLAQGNALPFVTERPLSSLHVVVKAPTWLDIAVDGDQVVRRRVDPGHHRLGVRAGAGTHSIRVASDAPVRVYARPHDAASTSRLATSVFVPRGATVAFDERARRPRGTLHCDGSRTPLSAHRDGLIELPACQGVARLALSWEGGPAPTWAELRAVRHDIVRGPPRGVVVVLVDTLRRDRTAGFAPTAPPSPATQRLADEGVRYTNALAAANWTKPSVATLLTGEHPAVHRAITHTASLRPDAPLLSRALNRAGVSTAAFVGNGYITSRYGFGGGWDQYTISTDLSAPGARGLFGEALDWIDGLDSRERFFMYVHTTDVHFPYDPPERFLEGVPRAGLRPRETPRLLHYVANGERTLSAAERAELVARYDAGVRAHDEALGAFVDGLRERRLLDEMLFVFVADHGEELFDHGSVGHSGDRMWPELVRVPLVLRWPDGAPAVVDLPAGHSDVNATIRDLFGLSPVGAGASLRRRQSGIVAPVVSARPGRILVVSDGTGGAAHDLLRGEVHSLGPDLERRPAVDAFTANRYLRWHAVTHPSAPLGRAWVAEHDAAIDGQLRALGYVE